MEAQLGKWQVLVSEGWSCARYEFWKEKRGICGITQAWRKH